MCYLQAEGRWPGTSCTGLALRSQTVTAQHGALAGTSLSGKDPESMYKDSKIQPVKVACEQDRGVKWVQARNGGPGGQQN